jgi:hypothetical protein
MNIFLESFISPFIKTSDFPIRLRTVDLQEYSYIDKKLVHSNVGLILDIEFFQQIYESKYVTEFFQSEEYKNAEKIFNLSEAKNKTEKFFQNDSYFYDIKNPKEYFDLSHCFLFESDKINSFILNLENIGEDYFRMNLLDEHFYSPLLGNLKSWSFFITPQCLMLLMLSHVTKIELPYVPKDYISGLLSSYDDLKYKYIVIGSINRFFNNESGLKEISKRLACNLGKTRTVSSSKFFVSPGHYKGVLDNYSLVYSIDNGNIIVRLVANKDKVDNYVVIYSNECSSKNKIIKEFKTAIKYFIDDWILLEVERK